MGGYFFISMHHMICDGASKVIFFRDLADSYRGKVLKEDHYFANLSRLEQESRTATYAKAREYYTAREHEHEWSRYPRLDGVPVVRGLGSISFLLPVDDRGYAKMTELYSIGKNAFVVAASVLSLAAYNDAEHISLKWTYHARESEIENDIMGMLIRDITFYIDLTAGMTLGDFLQEVRKQIMLGISYSCYPVTAITDSPNMSLCVNCQQEPDKDELADVLKMTEEEIPAIYDSNDNLINVELYEQEDRDEITINYLPSCYKEESMQRFRRMIMKSAALMVQHAGESGREIAQFISDIRRNPDVKTE